LIENKKPVGTRPTGWVQHDIPILALARENRS
jgi:hypothetical protein